MVWLSCFIHYHLLLIVVGEMLVDLQNMINLIKGRAHGRSMALVQSCPINFWRDYQLIDRLMDSEKAEER